MEYFLKYMRLALKIMRAEAKAKCRHFKNSAAGSNRLVYDGFRVCLYFFPTYKLSDICFIDV